MKPVSLANTYTVVEAEKLMGLKTDDEFCDRSPSFNNESFRIFERCQHIPFNPDL